MDQSPGQNRQDVPTVGPLRINKSSSPNQSPAGAAHVRRPPYPDQYPQPTSPPPNKPLPYPDDRQRRQHTPQSDHTLSSGSGTPASSHYGSHGPGRTNSPHPHFSATDPNRPSVAGYGRNPDVHPAGAGTAHGTQSNYKAQTPPSETPGQENASQTQATQYQYPQPAQANHVESSRPTPSQHFYPPPGPSPSGELRIPNASGVNRLASTTSISTTKAARGSPPPPETPVADYPPAGGIQARYAAAGIAGPSTLDSLQASSFAAQERRNEYSQQDPQGRRAEQPNQNRQQANGQVNENQAQSQSHVTPSRPARESVLEQDMQRMQVSDEPPPAYSSVSQGGQGYPVEKRTAAPGRPNLSVSAEVANAGAQGQPTAAQGTTQAQVHQPEHTIHSPQPSQPAATSTQVQGPGHTPSPAPSRASPPPLPEGWISHLDPNSGHYYYIHLPTQATQWEFPKGPTPLSLNEPPLSPTGTINANPFASPTATAFAGKPLGSPGLVPGHENIMSMASISSPTAAGFTVPPPSSGVDTYRVTPTNGVYFGPYLRYTNMDVENGIWYGSILIVVDGPHPPTIHIHQSQDLSPDREKSQKGICSATFANSCVARQLKANHIYQHQRWHFFRYDIDLRMEDDHEAKWTYAITSHLGCTRYEFLIAGRYKTSWRFIAHSGNDFAMNVNMNERNKVGGIGYMWKDILQKHMEVGGFHAQLGMGNQIYADRLWKEIPLLRQWTATSGKENRKNAPWTAQHEEEVTHAYFHFYTSHFDQPHLREAFAQIPHVLTLDDHDM